MKKLYQAKLIRPVITEKSKYISDEQNQYTFEVTLDARKEDIRRAVEEKFKVSVTKVRIIRTPGKRVMWGRKRIHGRKRDRKKAIVTLKSSDSIDLFKVK